MFNYINYNALNALLLVMVIFNSSLLYATDAAAEAISKIKNSTPTLYFTYNGDNEKYNHFVIEGSLIAGQKARIVYDTKRKDVLFKNNGTVYMRYSYDFWQTCQDIELKPTASGELGALIKLAPDAATIQVAFFAAYPYDNYKSWGYTWDSNYGKNFSANLISKKELEEKEKFEKLNAVNGAKDTERI